MTSPTTIADRSINALKDSLALLEAEAYDELQSTHPGARWRVLDLLTRATDRRRQIGALLIGPLPEAGRE